MTGLLRKCANHSRLLRAVSNFVVRLLRPSRREILKYNVAPRLGVRAVERRLRQRLPKLADSIDTSICAPL
jgi:hypothetical protein